MLVNLRINNFYSFNEEVNLSAIADMRTKKFSTSVIRTDNYNLLKTLAIYGPNNTGKSNIVKAFKVIKNVLLNKKFTALTNFFNKEKYEIDLGVTFLVDEIKYSFDFKYNIKNSEIVYEKFSEYSIDEYKNEKETIIYLKDSVNKNYESSDQELIEALKRTSKNNIVIYTLDVDLFSELNRAKKILTTFANKLVIIDDKGITIDKTLQILKNNENYHDKVVNFIKNADLYMDTITYRDELSPLLLELSENIKELKSNSERFQIFEQLKLTSTYRGIDVPSLLFDSTGTKKTTALASYLIEALYENKILIIDELDTSLHYNLTRSIISLFNNDYNKMAQLIFTTHDIGLIDVNKLFRKEQIWFTHKDIERAYLYSLAVFTANKDGIRNTTDIISKYKKGLLGSVPNPNLIKIFLEMNDVE